MTIEYGDVLHTVFGHVGVVVELKPGSIKIRLENGAKVIVQRKHIEMLVKAED